jgi:RNA polymerase sigma-70 factor, ECF subfamily
MKVSRAEFETLSLEHLDMLYRIARRLTGDASRAEDLVQETYLRAFRARHEFELKEHGIRPWLVRIMHNQHYSHWEREKRQPLAVDEAHLEEAGGAAEAAHFSAEGLQGMDERLVHALAELPVEYQVVMLMWAVDELSYKDIAFSCNVPIGTVMSRLHRARQKLAARLREFAQKEGLCRE